MLTACGPTLTQDMGYQDQHDDTATSDCLNCNQDEEEEENLELTHSGFVRASPEELMFFGDFQRNEELEESVSVQNQTHSAVLVTAVYVVGDTTIYGTEASEYFQTDWDHTAGNLLMPGEFLEIRVRFQPSHELRSGGLFIETTHVDFGLLDVDLSGKLFSDN